MDITATLNSYAKAYTLLKENLVAVPREAWSFKPSPEAWSIHEIIIHIADSEANGYIRCRKIIAEPGATVFPYNQDLWTSILEYRNMDTELYLEFFRIMRALNYQLLKDLEPGVWQNHVLHPEHGKVTLRDWLKIYDDHIYVHINQVKKNYTLWMSKQPGTNE